ncbi:MAG: hypothetical protein K8J08_22165 [Thermoanaerobaculia bacterium]|nr:hypothetical protein [Thermoanaerobaculia bacterium]
MKVYAMGWILALLVPFGGIAASGAEAEIHEIGTVGATFEAVDWERAQLAASLGKDQFLLIGGESYLVFFESFAIYEERDDFVEKLDRFIAGASANLKDFVIDSEIEFSRLEGVGRAIRRFSGVASGISVAYQIEVLSRGDGVGYLLLGWTTADRSSHLGQTMDSAGETFTLPGSDSDWFIKTQPTIHDYDFDPWTVSLAFRDSVLSPSASQPRERYSLEGDEGELAVHLFVDSLEGTIDQVLDQIVEVAASGEYEELLREEIDSPYGPAKQTFLRLEGVPATDIAIALIAIDDGRWADLRMATNKSIDRRQGLWNRLLAGLSVEAAEPIDAFPTVTQDDESSDQPLHPAAQVLLEAGRFLVSVPWDGSVHRAPTGDLLVRSDDQLTLYAASSSPSAKPTVLYEAAEDLGGDVLVWGDDTLLVRSGEETLRVHEGATHSAGFQADQASAQGSTLLLSRSPLSESLPGIQSTQYSGITRLFSRSLDGTERELAALPNQRVVALGLGQDSALVAAIPRYLPSSSEEANQQLYRIDRERGNVQRLGPWRTIKRIEPSDDGWLVSGQDSVGRVGVFRVEEGGEVSLLVRGGHEAIAGDGGRLLLLADDCRSGDQPQCVYELPMTAVLEHGLRLDPFQAQDLNAIAERLGEPAAVLSLEALEARIAAANAAARDHNGEAFPETSDGLDRLLASLVYRRELSGEALGLLADLVSWQLVADGAQFVPAVQASPARPGGSGWESRSWFAVALHPLSIVISTLYDEDGWYRPLKEIAEQTDGRQVLVSPDLAALRRGAYAAYPDAFDELVEVGSATDIGVFLADRRENLSLRGHVYQQLAGHGRGQVLTQVAEPFARIEDAAGIDVAAFYAERLSGELSPVEAEEMIAGLREAISLDPTIPGLYQQLGIAYEATERDDRRELAAACYDRVLELTSRGSVFEGSSEALERLSRETP